ncbi:MAG: efflux RND transporter periplasmic adaptor subunit [Phycisphaerae bacterium]|nr:efflux RND transporter periplasmic adaptor subunit [Phycisphaerae bacterium]
MSETDKRADAAKTPSMMWLRRVLGLATKLIIPVFILAGAGGFLRHQMNTRPQAQRMKPPREARLVSVETARVEDYATRVTAMGVATPAREVTISPEVSGVITRIDASVIPGGLIEQGQELFAIDARDYEALVVQRESEVARARLNLKLEAGNQAVAQAEFRLLEDVIGDEDEELVLRKPHLANALAALEAAVAALDKARLDVKRCTVRAPFNAIIINKYVDVGTRVAPTSPLLRLIGTDEYWVTAAVSMDELGWVELPDADGGEGSAVLISNPAAWGPEGRRNGRVLRLLGEVEQAGRKAQVLVSVKDPLNVVGEAGRPVLLNGSYVRMAIEGRMLAGAIAVQRAHLRDGDNVWVMNDNDALEIRKVTIGFADKEVVYVTDGIKGGERIVTTDLPAAVEGMPLRVLGETPAAKTYEGGAARP